MAKIKPSPTAHGANAVMPAGELASKKLCANAAPAVIPMMKMPECRLPVPICTRCLPGHPSLSEKQSPESAIPKKFQM